MIYSKLHCSWRELKNRLTPFTIEIFKRWYHIDYKDVIRISLSTLYDITQKEMADPNLRIMAEEVYNVIRNEVYVDSTVDIIYIDADM